MKVVLPNSSNPIRSRSKKVILGLSVLVFVSVLGYSSKSQSAVKEWLRLKGFYLSYFMESPISYVAAIPMNLARSVVGSQTLPVIAIDIKFKNWKKLKEKRSLSILKGVLIKGEDDFVKASIRYRGKTVKVNLRLKGDHLDHLFGNKWSFRIKVRGEERIFGMSQFSIQNPRVRRFQSEPLFYEALKDFGIMSPRYFYTSVYVNGEDIGVMALEEHFTKEMIEHNRRKESIFLRIDESRMFGITSKQSRSELETMLKSFSHNRIWRSPELTEDYENAVGLLRGFLNGHLNADQVFDVVLMGRFLAIVDVWAAGHGLAHNTRLYYNPITARLEPVGFDANIGEKLSFLDGNIIGKYFENSAVRLVYADTVRKLKQRMLDPAYQARFKEIDAQFEVQLRGEFFLKPPPSINLFRSFQKRISKIEESFADNPIVVGSFDSCNAIPFRAWAVNLNNPNNSTSRNVSKAIGGNEITNVNQPEKRFHMFGLGNLGLEHDNYGFSTTKHPGLLVLRCKEFETTNNTSKEQSGIQSTDQYFNLIDAFLVMDNEQSILEVVNAVPHPVDILNVFRDGKIIKIPDVSFPIKVAAEDMIEIVLPEEYKFYRSEVLVVRSAIHGEEQTFSSKTRTYAKTLTYYPVPVPHLINGKGLPPFLKLEDDDKTLFVKDGEWLVDETILVPAGFTLSIGPNTSLLFHDQAGIISYGRLLFEATVDEPIMLAAASPEKGWKGVVLLGNHEQTAAIMKGVIVRNANSFSQNKWRQTGGLVFYRSKLYIGDSRIEQAKSEDAINIVQSSFKIRNLTIEGSISDAIDSDFSSGTIMDSRFLNIGSGGLGDAIDLSGSRVVARDLKMFIVNDKGFSVGERSHLDASYIDIDRAGIGVASKDSSEVKISNSIIKGARIAGFMSYVKKREYGPARIDGIDIIIDNTVIQSRAQLGSYVMLNGIRTSEENINVKGLYDAQGNTEILN